MPAKPDSAQQKKLCGVRRSAFFFVEKEKFGFDIKASPFKRKPHINGKKKSK